MLRKNSALPVRADNPFQQNFEKRFASEALRMTVGCLLNQTRQLLFLMDDLANQTEQQQNITRSQIRFSLQQLRQVTYLESQQLHSQLSRLVKLEFLKAHNSHDDHNVEYELLYNGEGRNEPPVVFDLSEVPQATTNPSFV